MLKTQHHGPIYVSGFVFRRSPGKAIMLECRIEHVLAMARRFHPCVEDGRYHAVPRPRFRRLVRGYPPDAVARQSHCPNRQQRDLSVTRHRLAPIKRGLLKARNRSPSSRNGCLADSVENRGGILSPAASAVFNGAADTASPPPARTRKPRRLVLITVLLHCLSELSNYRIEFISGS